MTEIELRVPFVLGAELRDSLAKPADHEQLAFLLVSHMNLPGRVVLLARHVMYLPENAYLRQSEHGAAWRGAAMLPIITRAIDERLGVVLVHEHARESRAQLSDDDRKSASRVVPMLRRRVPGRPHGSIVFARENAEGIIALPHEEPERFRISVRWLGASIVHWNDAIDPADNDDERYASQRLVVRASQLRRATVAVVGLSGGGSHVVQQCAHLGVGMIVGVDDDITEERHRSRMVGLPGDCAAGTAKVDVMARLVQAVQSDSRFVPVRARVPETAALHALRGVDVIVGCVDSFHARQDLQEIAWRFAIPYVDVGVNIRGLDDAGRARVSIGGNVLTLVPGGFCMWCCGYLSKQRLDTELAGPNRNYLRNLPGEAQVVSMNGVVASQAVNEVLRLLTGFGGVGVTARDLALAGDRAQRGFIKFDGVRGTLEDWGATRRADCDCCKQVLALGDAVWD